MIDEMPFPGEMRKLSCFSSLKLAVFAIDSSSSVHSVHSIVRIASAESVN